MVLKKVLVTGASGMVGRHLLDLLKERGIEVVSTSRRPLKKEGWFFWDLKEWKTTSELTSLFGSVEAIFHLGAMVPEPAPYPAYSRREMFETNVSACLCLGEWAMELDVPLVFLSGAIVYADTSAKRISENDPKIDPVRAGFYGFSKWQAEMTLSHLTGSGLRCITLRPTSIYGEGLSSKKMIARFLKTAASDGTIELAPPVSDRINLIHAEDVARAMLAALERGNQGVYNIAGSSLPSVREIADVCVQVVGKGKVIEMRTGEAVSAQSRYDLSIEAAQKMFNFKAEINLLEGLRRMWSGMQEAVK